MLPVKVASGPIHSIVFALFNFMEPLNVPPVMQIVVFAEFTLMFELLFEVIVVVHPTHCAERKSVTNIFSVRSAMAMVVFVMLFMLSVVEGVVSIFSCNPVSVFLILI